MKHFKFISLILLFLVSFLGNTEFYEYPVELSHAHAQDLFILDSDTPQILSTNLSAHEADVHFVVKKKQNSRVVGTYSSISKKSYYSSLLNFKVLRNKIIYSVAVIYKNEGHTHLHLYQLF